jgi:hypothetical protein
MKMRPLRVTSIGILALALGAATSAGPSGVGASATTEPVDPASSAAPGDMAAGCVEITALLDAVDGIGAAFFAEDGVAIGDILATLPALGDAALAAAPPEIAETVAVFVAPLPELAAATAEIDFTDLDSAVEALSSLPPMPESDEADPEVRAWAETNCGWTSSFVDPFAEAPEPPDCEVLDAAVAAAAAGLDVDVADSDGSGGFNLSSYWTKSCSYGNGAMSLSTISFTSIEQATEFFVDNIGDGEFLDVDLGSLPASTLVTVRDGLLAVTVFEATVPFGVGFNADEVTPEAAVAAALAVLATLPEDVPMPGSSEAP